MHGNPVPACESLELGTRRLWSLLIPSDEPYVRAFSMLTSVDAVPSGKPFGVWATTIEMVAGPRLCYRRVLWGPDLSIHVDQRTPVSIFG